MQLANLPAPDAALAQLKRSSAQVLSVNGGENENPLPINRFAAMANTGVFTPDWSPQSDSGPAGLAFAMYRLNLEGHTGSSLLRLLSPTAGVDPRQVYIGLSHWELQRWDWTRLAGGLSSQPRSFDTVGYVGASGDLLVVVAVMGTREFQLSRLTVADYDEVEPNNTAAEANDIGAESVLGFRGRVGGSDAIDIFSIPGTEAEQLRGWIWHEDDMQMRLRILRADGSQVAERTTSEGSDRIQIFQSPDLSAADFPLRLELETLAGETDYVFSFGHSLDVNVGLLTAEPRHGPLPFTTTFSASATNGPDVLYRWDVDDDGSIDAETTVPTLQWTYTQDGLYRVELYARNSIGAEIQSGVTVLAGDGPYHEREDNDFEEDANVMDPAQGEDGWLGNVGESFSGGYDGDHSDWVSLEIPGGHAALITLTDLDNAPEDSEVLLSGGPAPAPGRLLLNPGTEPLAQLLSVTSNGPPADYRLNWKIGRPPVLTAARGHESVGEAPFTMVMSVSVSHPDGHDFGAVSWDFDGDGIEDAVGLEAQHEFTVPGEYVIIGSALDEHGFLGRFVHELLVTD